MRNLKRVFILLALLFAPLLPLFAARATPSNGEVHYVRVQGIVNPVMAEFLKETLEDAALEGAEVLVVELDTPGGLDLSMREIVKSVLASDVPVVVYVAPAGSRAASAGVFITYAANIASMAPGTNIGSAHPVTMGGEQADEVMMEKVVNDSVAYIKGIAAKRGRNAKWAEDAVRKSVNITAEEALKLGVIDLIAENREALIRSIDGRKVEVAAGERVLNTADAAVRDIEMGLRFRVLDAISNPNVAYILMMIGLIGLYFELANPGSIFPGAIGAISLVLAFYAFQTLSINYAGLLLIGLGVLFFIVELNVVSYGLLTIAGLVSIVLGSLMLFESPLPFMRLSVWVMLPTVIFMVGFIALTMYYAISIRRKKPVSGAEGLVGEAGVALEDIAPGFAGKVFVEGEYWDAESEGEIKKDERIRVVGIKGLTLRVKKAR